MALNGIIKRVFGRGPVVTATPAWATYIDAAVPDIEAVRARWNDVTTAREIAKRAHGPALGCAILNAKTCASVPLRLYRTGGSSNGKARRVRDVRKAAYLRDFRRVGRKAAMYADQDDDMVEVLEHEVLQVLRRPNPQRTGSEYETERWLHKWLFGNSVELVLRNGGAFPIGMVSLMPQYVRVQPDTERFISGYWFGREEIDVELFDADDVMHRRLSPHWFNPYWGMGPLDIVFRELDLYEFSLAAEQARWKNGGYPSGVLSMKNVRDQEQLDQITRGIERRTAGVDKTGKLLVTTESTYAQLGKTNEMGYLPGMAHIERRVEQEFGVPESIRRLNDSNLASASEGVNTYLRFTVQPALSIDAEQLTELLLPRFGIEPGEMWFAYDDVNPEDHESLRQDTAVHVAGGVLTFNEQRARLGYDPVEGGDIPRVNGVPLDRVGEARQFGFATPGSGEPDRPDEPDEPDAEPDDEAEEDDAEKSIGTKVVPGDLTQRLLDDPSDTELIEELRRDVEEWLLTARDRIRVSPDGTIDFNGAEADLERVLFPKLERLVQRGFAVGAEDLLAFGVSPGGVNDDMAAAVVRRRGSLLIERIRGTTRDDIREALLVGFEDGRPLNEVMAEVRASIGETARSRAETIARTEISNAVHEGRFERWRASGVARVRWVLAPGACEICTALVARSGGEVELGRAFVGAGEQIGSYTPVMPVLHPPAHPNCRCTVVPVFGD